MTEVTDIILRSCYSDGHQPPGGREDRGRQVASQGMRGTYRLCHRIHGPRHRRANPPTGAGSTVLSKPVYPTALPPLWRRSTRLFERHGSPRSLHRVV